MIDDQAMRVAAMELVLKHARQGEAPDALVRRAEQVAQYLRGERATDPFMDRGRASERDIARTSKSILDGTLSDLTDQYLKHTRARRAELAAIFDSDQYKSALEEAKQANALILATGDERR